jgi:hypothetical protein
MKSAKNTSAIIIFSITIFCGCRKDALEVNADLAGFWNTERFDMHSGSSMEIGENSATYTQGTDSDAKEYSGTAKISNDLLKIGRMKQPITAYPGYDAAGNYYLELNRSKFIGAYAVLNPTATVSANNATISWDDIPNTDGDLRDAKEIDYRIVSTSTWSVANAVIASVDFTLASLAPATTYEWKIKSVRGTHSSQFSAVQTFMTN